MSQWNAFEHSATPKSDVQRWHRVTMMDSEDVHVVPLNDSMSHELSMDCPCQPRSNDSSVEMQEVRVITHSAFDGREGPS